MLASIFKAVREWRKTPLQKALEKVLEADPAFIDQIDEAAKIAHAENTVWNQYAPADMRRPGTFDDARACVLLGGEILAMFPKRTEGGWRRYTLEEALAENVANMLGRGPVYKTEEDVLTAVSRIRRAEETRRNIAALQLTRAA